MKQLEYELHDVKNGKVTVQTFSFTTWHLNQIEEVIKQKNDGVTACMWQFMKLIKVDEQYLQYMAAMDGPPKEWIGLLPEFTLNNEGYFHQVKEIKS